MYAHKRPSSHILGCLKKKKGKRETHLRRMCVGTARRRKKKKRPANPVGALRAASERCALCVQTLKKMRAKEGEFFFSFPKTFQPLKRGLFLIFKRKKTWRLNFWNVIATPTLPTSTDSLKLNYKITTERSGRKIRDILLSFCLVSE